MLRSHYYVEKKWLNCLDGFLSIMIDKEDILIRTNQCFFPIRAFNKEHVIHPKNVTISNTLEE